MEQIPLLEFDPDEKGIIEAAHFIEAGRLTEHCVMPIYTSLVQKLAAKGVLEPITSVRIKGWQRQIFTVQYDGREVTVLHPGVGAPLVTGNFEVMIGLGCRKFVACGSAGVLKPELKRGTVVIPNSALRDEGTSYHYCSPSRTIEMDSNVVDILEAVLCRHQVNYEIGRTWTNDAFFRETAKKIKQRQAEGCITVEMECAALAAAARLRKVKFGQYLAAGDDVSGAEWDPRYVEDKMPFEEKVFWLSVEACLEL